MGIVANVKEYNTLKAIDDLLKINFNLSDELGAEKLNETLKSMDKGVNDKTMEMAQIMQDIIIQENNIKNWSERIDNYKDKMTEIKDKMGMAKMASFVNSEYRKMKKDVKTLKKLKKRAAEDIIKKYAQYKLKKQEQKDIRRNRKQLAKEIKEYAKERKEEIKFVKYFEKNKRKMFRKDPENYEKIQNMIDMIMDNGGKWPENVQDEKGNIVTLEEALEMMKNGKAKDLKQIDITDKGKDGEEKPQEEKSEEEKNNEEKREEEKKEEKEEYKKQEEQNEEQNQIKENKEEKEEKEDEEPDMSDYYGNGYEKAKEPENKKEDEEPDMSDYYGNGYEKAKEPETKNEKHDDFIKKINNNKTPEELRQQAEQEAEESELRAQEVAAKERYDRKVKEETERRSGYDESGLEYDEDEGFGYDD